MKIGEIIRDIEEIAPIALQENYDNAGWQVGDLTQEIMGVLICLDVTEEVVNEAIATHSNLIISHHPLLFREIKSLIGTSYIERCVINAIRNNISIYSAHTNLDNASKGVNYHIAKRIGLTHLSFLRKTEDNKMLDAGAGMVGLLSQPEDEEVFLLRMKELFQIGCVKHTAFRNRKVQKVALCGGSGSFLITDAIASGADVFLTSDLKYHDYFEVENRILLADLGHYESEQYTKEIIYDIIRKKSTTFAVQFTKVNTNPIKYL